MIDYQSDGVIVYDHITLAADIACRLITNSLFVDQRIAREYHIAKLASAVVQFKVIIGIRVLAHSLTQFGESKAFLVFIYQHLLQTNNICILRIDIT